MTSARFIIFGLLLVASSQPAFALSAAEEAAQSVLRPATSEERIAGLGVAKLERTEKKDGTPLLRLSLIFDPKGRSLLAEHVIIFQPTPGTPVGPQRIDIEIGLRRRLTPVRFVTISNDGKTETETWVLQSTEDIDDDASRLSLAVCPPPPPAPKPCPTPAPPPPIGRRITVAPSLLLNHHTATDRVNGASISVGGPPSFSLGISAGYLWTKSIETVFELSAGGFRLSNFPSGTLLDTGISFWSLGVGVRHYLTESKETYAEALVGYDRRFYIRAAGSGYYAAAPFDFPQGTVRLGAMLILPQPWGLFAGVEGHGIVGIWSSGVRPHIGAGFDARVQAVLRHPLARLRFGLAGGYESIDTDLVYVSNARYRFELALDWEL